MSAGPPDHMQGTSLRETDLREGRSTLGGSSCSRERSEGRIHDEMMRSRLMNRGRVLSFFAPNSTTVTVAALVRHCQE